MKIESMVINIVPTHDKDTNQPRTLVRRADKLWQSVSHDGSVTEGLYPGDIRLASLLNEVIQKYNGGNNTPKKENAKKL